MVDYHVDRPQVEASQDVELSGTNSPEFFRPTKSLHCSALGSSSLYSFPAAIGFELRLVVAAGDQVSGAYGGGVPPVPIPNTAVKPASADDRRSAGTDRK